MNRPPQPWPRAVLHGLGVVYLPQLAGAALSPLGECDHCVNTFFMLFPVVPGALVAVLFQGDRTVGLLLGGIAALALVAGVTAMARRWTAPKTAVAVILGLLSAVNSSAFCHVLRA